MAKISHGPVVVVVVVVVEVVVEVVVGVVVGCWHVVGEQHELRQTRQKEQRER